MKLHAKYKSMTGAWKKNKKYFRTTHKLGIKLPKAVAEAIEIDWLNGNMIWWDAIEKEKKAVVPAFSDDKTKVLSV